VRLEDLRKNILEMGDEELQEFITEMREERFEALSKKEVAMKATAAKKGTRKSQRKLKVTQEQLELLQQLGVV